MTCTNNFKTAHTPLQHPLMCHNIMIGGIFYNVSTSAVLSLYVHVYNYATGSHDNILYGSVCVRHSMYTCENHMVKYTITHYSVIHGGDSIDYNLW